MNIKNIWQSIKKPFTVDLASAGVDTRYSSEIAADMSKKPSPVAEAIRYRKQAVDAEQKLEAAAELFREIDCLMLNTELPLISRVMRGQSLAQDGYRAATK